ncbi:Endonuclease/exonuclease/phosphatase [Podospora appendiculata]|uniref:Endonuclease/exonuclease/phosphatase n=1 Tax=Podospora appendiculata TaxID=314037 RepID=A0AAE0XHV1_9PEZI|nr:Endonuclease/exonuclease/phosphatase [Podospora appendiculata]
MAELPAEISLVTLNCWGLKYISKLRRERMTEIGRQLALADPQPHIVALQECWTQEDYQSIRHETRFILPHGKFYHSGPFGGGLAILSRWPIEESTMFRYPLNGRPTAFFRGDWFVGKGVACARIRYGPDPKHVIEVFNTHTHAPYEHGPNDSYQCHRTAQAWEVVKLLRGAAERGHLVLAMGDFNMIPSSLEYRIITSLAPVRDTWRVLHPDSAVGPAVHPAEQARHRPVPTAEFNIIENGAASDGPTNTWRWAPAQQKLLGRGKPEVPVPPETLDHKGKRLDYIFVGPGALPALGGSWTVRRARVGMMMRHPELGCSLSDHFAVEATLAFQPSTTSTPTAAVIESPVIPVSSHLPTTTAKPNPEKGTSTGTAETKETFEINAGTYLQSPTTSSFHSLPIPSSPKPSMTSAHQPPSLPLQTYDAILANLTQYIRRERAQTTWRTRHFLFWVLATIGCYVAVWFSPRNFVSFLLILVSSLGLAAGTVDGLMALLFFNGAEARALKEFGWEVRNARAIAAGDGGHRVEDGVREGGE